MGLEDHVKTKRLWRLRDAQPCTIRRRLDVAIGLGQLDGVGDGDRGDRRAGAAGGVDRARDQRRRDKGPRRVMDQDDVGLVAGERFQSGMDRGLPRRAAAGWRLMPQAGHRFVEQGGIVGIDHRLHREDFGMAAEWLHRAKNHGLPADCTILFWTSRAGAEPAPGCDKDGCGTLGFWHLDKLRANAG